MINFLTKINMFLFHFEKAVSFFTPKSLIFMAGETPQAAPEMYSQAEALEKFAGEYREIPAGTRIDFTSDNGLGLVSKLVQKMKTMPKFQNLNDKQITGSAVAVAARMARAGVGHSGFDVNLFRKGSSVEFKGNDEVTIHYVNFINPSDTYKTPATLSFETTLNLSTESAHAGVVAETRDAINGVFFNSLQEAARSGVIYTVASVLGYNWANSAEKMSFMNKLKEIGFTPPQDQKQRNQEACRFISGLLDGSIRYETFTPRETAQGLKMGGIFKKEEVQTSRAAEVLPEAPAAAPAVDEAPSEEQLKFEALNTDFNRRIKPEADRVIQDYNAKADVDITLTFREPDIRAKGSRVLVMNIEGVDDPVTMIVSPRKGANTYENARLPMPNGDSYFDLKAGMETCIRVLEGMHKRTDRKEMNEKLDRDWKNFTDQQLPLILRQCPNVNIDPNPARTSVLEIGSKSKIIRISDKSGENIVDVQVNLPKGVDNRLDSGYYGQGVEVSIVSKAGRDENYNVPAGARFDFVVNVVASRINNGRGVPSERDPIWGPKAPAVERPKDVAERQRLQKLENDWVRGETHGQIEKALYEYNRGKEHPINLIDIKTDISNGNKNVILGLGEQRFSFNVNVGRNAETYDNAHFVFNSVDHGRDIEYVVFACGEALQRKEKRES